MLKQKLMIALAALLLAFTVACGPPPAPEDGHADETHSAEESHDTAEDGDTSHSEDGDAQGEEEMAEEEMAEEEMAEEPAPAADLGGATELEHIVIVEGSGDKPAVGDFVKIDFIGTLKDGTEFVNSYAIGEPLVAPFGQGIFFAGWDTALSMMTIGEEADFIIPAAQAFGEQGAGTDIPPNADLYFNIKMIEILDVEIEILEEGDGPIPEQGQTIRVHYTGTLEDGTEFDSSIPRGEPIEFPLGAGAVIPGWDIGLGRLAEGTKAILTIPSELAYGAQGSPPTIPPNATLIFEVELVEVVR